MSENLSGNYTTVQTLAAGAPQVTVSGTINAYGTIGQYTAVFNNNTLTTFTAEAALFGPASGQFTITNSGLIETQGTNPDNLFDVGIVLGAAGTVTSSGTILGASGIAVFETAGSSYVENSSLIEGSIGVGVVIFGSAVTTGTVVNSGTIINMATRSGGGAVAVFGNGFVTNAAGGTLVSDSYYVINGQGGQLTVTNAGAVIGLYGGINLQGGGFVTNAGYIHVTGTGNTLSNSSYAGINAQLGSAIFNSGTILSQNGIVAGYDSSATPGFIEGYVSNTGLIQAFSTNTVQNNGASAILGDGMFLQVPERVVNAGSITASNAGIYTQKFAFVQNLRNGIITSQIGIHLSGGGYAGNSGTVQGYSNSNINGNSTNGFNTVGVGVYLGASGTVFNQGTVSGNHDGIVTQNDIAFVDNTSLVTSSRGYGVYLGAGGILTNSGSISGYREGVRVGNVGNSPATIINAGTIAGDAGIIIGSQNAATVVNSGTITGTDGFAIVFTSPFFFPSPNELQDDPGAVFNGQVEDANGLGFLELESAATEGTLQGFGTQFTGFDAFEIAGAAVWDIAGPTSIDAAITLLNDGTLAETSADALTIGGAIIGNGAIDLDVTTVTLAGSVGAGQQISFTQTGSDLVLGDPSQFDGSIYRFAAGDTIELSGIPFTSTGGTYGTPGEDTYTVANAGTLSIDADGTVYNFFIANATVGQDNFVLSNDLAITETACYAAGTRIATAIGEVKVEDLEIGDYVETLNGSLQKIKWIGRRSYDGRFIAGNKDILPIRIARGAIGDKIPARDLFVSPGHAICIDGALIHAFRLVNGVSITQAQSVESVVYYHIETENHEIIFAENCPAETFLDENFRAQFQNAGEYRALYPNRNAAATPCLPLLEDGFALHAIQQRLAARAGIAPAPETKGPLRGYVDQAGPIYCTGWAQDIENPETPVCLDILLDGAQVAQVLANLYRADLRQAGLGSGCHAFRATLPPGLAGQRLAGQLEIRRTAGGANLPWTNAALTQAA